MCIRIKPDLAVEVSAEYAHHLNPKRWKVSGYRYWSDGSWKEVKGSGVSLQGALDDFAKRYNAARKP